MTTPFYTKSEIQDGLREVANSLTDSKKIILSVKYLFDHTNMTDENCNDDLILGFEGLKQISKDYKNVVQKYRDLVGVDIETQIGQENVSADLTRLAEAVGSINANALSVLNNTKKGIDSIPYNAAAFQSQIDDILTKIDADIHLSATKHAHLKNLNTQKNDTLFDNSELIEIYDYLHSADKHRTEAAWILNSKSMSASSVKIELAECVWALERARSKIIGLEGVLQRPVAEVSDQKSVKL